MRKILYILLSFFTSLSLFAQVNLVPNGDFETTITPLCPVGIIDVAPPWQNPSWGSPNYMNGCTTTQPDYSVPQNMFGFQYAHSGTGYVYFGTIVNSIYYPNHREYIQVQLSDSLKYNKTYFVKFYISLADSANYAIDRAGLYFSDTAIYKSIAGDHGPFSNFTPQIENPAGNFISDKINWTVISGIYTANGGEQWITIGNFYDDANTDTVYLPDGSITQLKESGFYIDDVSVIEDTGDGIEEMQNRNNNFKVYPNPAINEFTIETKNIPIKNTKLVITDLPGRKVKEILILKETGKQIIDASAFAGGIYLYRFSSDDGIIGEGKIVVMK